MSQVMDIDSTFVVVNKDLEAETVDVSDKLWAEIDERFGDFAGSSLISSFSFEDDWPSWEVHPHGDEFVCLLAGDVEMTLALADGDQTVHLDQPGSFVIVPKGTWHTAKVNAPTRMLFVTPGQDTENREQPVRSSP